MIIGIYGYSKSGKTTLIENLVKELSKKYKVATIKHISEKNFSIDKEGKDTFRHRKAGASLTVAFSGNETAFIFERMKFEEVLKAIENFNFDLIMLEGFKGKKIKKIAIGGIKKKQNTIFRWKIGNSIGEILFFIEQRIKEERIYEKLPKLNCKKCGFDCFGFAKQVAKGKKKFENCYYFSEINIELRVNKKEIPLGKFTKEIIAKTLKGMVSSLKEVKKVREIELRVKEGNIK